MNDLLINVIEIATEYLGPAAEKFVRRQIQYHLENVTVETFTIDNIPKLADWMKISASLIIDPILAEEMSKKVLKLRR